jgi:peptidoglycan/LPS O-acetylase OafA/YrhL
MSLEAAVKHCEKTSLLKAYFPGLNELRALAALCVILSHIEQMKELAGLPFHYWFPIPGKLGVILFFALSGFLITSILIREKTIAPYRVDLRKFYMKRVLRIWPLYFLVTGASLLIINHLTAFQVPMLSTLAYDRLDTRNILLLLFILPNYVEILIPYLTQIWSIGIEEQFYLVQPFIVKHIKTDTMLIIIMLLTVFLKELLLLINKFLNIYILHDIANQSVFLGCIAIGCLSALICRNYADLVVKVIHNRIVQLMSLILFISTLILISVYKDVTIIDYRFHAIIFSIIIVNAATNPGSLYNLNNKHLDYLGKISYGLYMYHEFGIGCSIAIIKYFDNFFQNYMVLEIAVYFTSLLITLLLSALSFKYFEGFFLGFKNKLTH